jgi:hypothetical protein
MGIDRDSDLARAVERIEDREAIRELMNQYCFIQDRGHTSHADEDIDAFLALCAPDFVWDNSDDGSRAHRGPAAVRTYLRGLWRRFDSCMHFVHNLSIDLVSPGHARGRSSFDAAGDIGGEAFVAAGTYVDEYVRTADGWRFALHREVPFFFVKLSEGWAGPKPRIMREWTRG